MAQNQITYQTYQTFVREYDTTDRYVNLRFGQAFMNQFVRNVTDPDLFYCRDRKRAEGMIMDRYITF